MIFRFEVFFTLKKITFYLFFEWIVSLLSASAPLPSPRAVAWFVVCQLPVHPHCTAHPLKRKMPPSRRNLIGAAAAALATVVAIYKWTTPFEEEEDEEDATTTEISATRSVEHHPTALSVVESSKLYQLLWNKLLALPHPLWRPLTSTSLYQLAWIQLRAIYVATVFTLSGSLNLDTHVPIFVRSFLHPFERTGSLSASPHVGFSSELQTSADNELRWMHQLLIQRQQGSLQDCCVDGYKVQVSVKATPSLGWDNYLRQSDQGGQSGQSDQNDQGDQGDQSGQGDQADQSSRQTAAGKEAQSNTTATPNRPPTRHMRLSSGLTWKCALCGERSEIHKFECSVCGTARPSIIPKRGELEETTPTKTQEESAREEEEQRRRMAQQNRLRRQRTGSGQANSPARTSPPTSSPPSPSSPVSSSSTSSSSSSSSYTSSSSSSSYTSSSSSSSYTVINLILVCPKQVTSMESGRLYGSIMTIFAAIEQFSNGAVENCTVTPRQDEDGRYEIDVKFSLRDNVLDLPTKQITKTMEKFHIEEIKVSTSIIATCWIDIISNDSNLWNTMSHIDSVVDGLQLQISTSRSAAATALGGGGGGGSGGGGSGGGSGSGSGSGNESGGMGWFLTMAFLCATLPTYIVAEIVSSNFKCSRLPRAISYAHALVDDCKRWGRSQESTKMVLEIVTQQWSKMKPFIENIRSVTISSKDGTIELDCEPTSR